MHVRNWLQLWIFGVWFGCASAFAQEPGPEQARDATRTLSPYFLVEDAPDGVETFPLESTDVVANVNGVIADVTVRQTYRNDGSVPIHARYVFPASTRAAVHGMEMTVGDKRVLAKVKEREQATQEFEQAKAEGKTAALLDEDRPNVFSMSVGNIMPGDRVQVALRYSELLVPDEGVYHFVFPTVVGPRYSHTPADAAQPTDAFVASPYLHQGDSPPAGFSLHVNLSTGVPLANVDSKTHDIYVNYEGHNLARVSLVDSEHYAANRDFVLDYRLSGAQIESGLLLYQGEHENHFLLMVQPPARVTPAEIPPREYVFVLDVSGSMYGFPLDTAKALISDLIGSLRPSDTFNVLLFAGDSQLMAPRSLPATQENVQRALALIDEERGGGGTELEAALRKLQTLPRSEHVSRSVVVLTDGYIAEERGAFDLVAKNLNRTNVFAFGIGSSVNRYLIEGLARTGQGEPFVVESPEEAPAAAARFRSYIESPVLTEIGVDFHGFDAYDVEPRVQPDLFAQRPVVVLGKWRGPRAGTIEVHGHTAHGPFTSTLNVGETPARAENAALPQLWARSRIARLSDFEIGGDDPKIERQVTALGLEYSLLTKYTSFIAVLQQIRNPGGQAAPVDQPLPLPVGVSERAIGGDYEAGDEPELLALLALVLAILGLTALRRRAEARPA